MKKIILFSFLLISLSSYSQLDRRIGRTPNMNVNNQKQEKIDPIEATLVYLKQELNLDTFQEAATKTFIEENFKEKEYIISLDISDDDKKARLIISHEKMNTQIETLLNTKQKEDFARIRSKGKDKKKK